MSSRRVRCSTLLVVGCAWLGSGTGARANGRFPEAGSIVFHPLDEQRFAVSSTFGLLESRDGGRNFSWTCEFVLGVAGEQDFVLAITAGGSLVAGTFNGILASHDGCSFERAAELATAIIPDLALSRGAPDTVVGFRTVGIGSGLFETQLVRSSDDARTWQLLEPALPEQLLPLTIDVAPSDPQRIYVSGRLDLTNDFQSVVLRSSDGGASFEMAVVPETSGQRLAYIAAMHPTDADQLYVRVDDPNGTVVWWSSDGGQTFSRIFTGSGRLLGFGLSPDASRLALGGPNDGIWVGAPDGSDLGRRSDLGVSCLTWSSTGIYICTDALLTGFSLGRSRDEASSFEPLLAFFDLCGSSGCEATSQACAADWQLTAPRLGATCGLTEPAGAETDAGALAPEQPPPSDEQAPSSDGRRPLASSSGCTVIGSGKSASRIGWLLALCFGWLARRRWFSR